ncbi:MAG: T9SS type A sorting domain-containing protein [Bacteroidales bacterium]|nr:T9SS type A sorting domain-containing protein [Bacteroidales bacterium]
MKKTILLVFIIYASVLYSQTPELTWQSCYGASSNDYIGAILKSDYGYLLSASASNNELQIPGYHGGSDAWVIATDSLGNFLWHKCFGGTRTESEFVKILECSDGTYYLFGSSSSEDGDLNTPIQGMNDLWLVKVDSEFNIIWQRAFGSPAPEEVRDAILTSDGGVITLARVYAAGYNVSVAFGMYDIWVCKFGADGEMEWEKTLGNQYNDNAIKIKKGRTDPVETYYIIGSSEYSGGMVGCHVSPSYGQDVIVYEIDRGGNLLWHQCYGGSDSDLGKDFISLPDGFVFVASSASSDFDVSGNTKGNAIWVVRCNQAGEIIWQRTYGGSGREWPVYIDTVANGGFVVIGNSSSKDGDVVNQHGYGATTDVWILALDSLGNILSSKCFGSTGWETFFNGNSIARSGDFDYTIAVTSRFNDGDVTCATYGNDDIWLFEIKDCTYYAPTTPSTPAGPANACSASPNPGVYTVPNITNQTTEWKLEPSDAGSIITGKDSLLIYWSNGYEGTVAISARGINDCGASAWSPPIYTQVETCAGISTHSLNGLKIWPNPAKTHLNIEIPANVQLPVNIQISDVSGRTVLSQQLVNHQSTLDVSNIRRGVYFCILQYPLQNIHGKLVIQ